MATIDITVTSQFNFVPDAVYLLEGANVNMKVYEENQGTKIGNVDSDCIYDKLIIRLEIKKLNIVHIVNLYIRGGNGKRRQRKR